MADEKNIIQIKRGTGVPPADNGTNNGLAAYELGWSTDNKLLYINNYDQESETDNISLVGVKPEEIKWNAGTVTEEGYSGTITVTGVGIDLSTNIPVASTTSSGIISTDAQTIAGDKTFNDNVQVYDTKFLIDDSGLVALYKELGLIEE